MCSLLIAHGDFYGFIYGYPTGLKYQIKVTKGQTYAWIKNIKNGMQNTYNSMSKQLML